MVPLDVYTSNLRTLQIVLLVHKVSDWYSGNESFIDWMGTKVLVSNTLLRGLDDVYDAASDSSFWMGGELCYRHFLIALLMCCLTLQGTWR